LTNIIRQKFKFNTSPELLFDFFTDSKKHSEATGAKASTSRKVGGKWSAFDGMICGRNLVVIPKRMIVQAWRAAHWKKTDLDSILILNFNKVRGGGRIDLVHVNVPDHDIAGVSHGWPKYYWKPWRAYLKRKAGKG
jgi:activator of HSP90 ATPase